MAGNVVFSAWPLSLLSLAEGNSGRRIPAFENHKQFGTKKIQLLASNAQTVAVTTRYSPMSKLNTDNCIWAESGAKHFLLKHLDNMSMCSTALLCTILDQWSQISDHTFFFNWGKVSKAKEMVVVLLCFALIWTGSLLLGCHYNTNSSPSAPAHFLSETTKRRLWQKVCWCWGRGIGILLLLLRQDPLDLSFWSFLTFLHYGIEEVNRHLLWKFHPKIQKKSWSKAPPKLLACDQGLVPFGE